MTRRRALGMLGIGAAAAAIPKGAFAQEPTFPKGAIIRTLLKDYAPEELAGGATLFHEHMQLGPDFNAKFARGDRRGSSREWFAARAPRAAEAATQWRPSTAPDIMRDVDLMAAEVAKTKSRGRRLHCRCRTSGHGARHQLHSPGFDEIRRADRGRRRLLLRSRFIRKRSRP